MNLTSSVTKHDLQSDDRFKISLESLLASWPYHIHPLREQYQPNVTQEIIHRILKESCLSDFASGKPMWFSVDTNSTEWICAIKRLQWDSEFFGFEVARLDPFLHQIRSTITQDDLDNAARLVSHAVGEARESGIQHMTASADPGDAVTIHALEQSGFRLKDTMMYHFFDTEKLPFEQKERKTRLATVDDSPFLEDLTVRCFADRTYNANRFSNDPQYPASLVAEMYRIWVRKSITGERADVVLVIEFEGKPVGYLTGILPTPDQIERGVDFGDMGLGAVDPNYHRHGFFRTLHRELLTWFKENKIRRVQTRTALSTAGVNKSCIRNGSAVPCSPHTFHINLTSKTLEN